MENKKTKKVFFKELAEMVENSNGENKTELLNFINHEIELLEKKAMNRKTGNDKKTKANIELAELIIQELAILGKTTLTELLKKSEPLASYVTDNGKPLSNQKITAVLKPYIRTDENPDGQIIRTVEKKMIYFTLAE